MVKVVLKLVWMLLSLTMYLHCSACLIYYIAAIEKEWVPPVGTQFSDPADFYSQPKKSQYIQTLYTSALILTGNEMQPVGDL